MSQKDNPVPEGVHTITAHLVVRNAAEAIEFYRRAFGAKEILRLPAPDGAKIMHAELRIGDSAVMLCDEVFEAARSKSPQSLNGTSVVLHIRSEDVDKAFKKAVKAGAKVSMPVTDMFWGDRYGKLTDPFGHEWSMAQHIKDMTPEEIAAAAQEFFSQPSA